MISGRAHYILCRELLGNYSMNPSLKIIKRFRWQHQSIKSNADSQLGSVCDGGDLSPWNQPVWKFGSEYRDNLSSWVFYEGLPMLASAVEACFWKLGRIEVQGADWRWFLDSACLSGYTRNVLTLYRRRKDIFISHSWRILIWSKGENEEVGGSTNIKKWVLCSHCQLRFVSFSSLEVYYYKCR